MSQLRKSYCNSVPILVLRESSGWSLSLGQRHPESTRFDSLDSLEPQVHIPEGLGATLPPSQAVNSVETRLSTWPTFRKDLETGATVDLGDHVVLPMSRGGFDCEVARPKLSQGSQEIMQLGR